MAKTKQVPTRTYQHGASASHPNNTIAKWYAEAIERARQTGEKSGRFVLLVQTFSALNANDNSIAMSHIADNLSRIARITELHLDFAKKTSGRKVAALHRMAAFCYADGGCPDLASEELNRSFVALRDAKIPPSSIDLSLKKLATSETSTDDIAISPLIKDTMAVFLRLNPNRRIRAIDPVDEILETDISPIKLRSEKPEERARKTNERMDLAHTKMLRHDIAKSDIATGSRGVAIGAAITAAVDYAAQAFEPQEVFGSVIALCTIAAGCAIIVYNLFRVLDGLDVLMKERRGNSKQK